MPLRPAALPMYDLDRAAVAAWWTGVAGALRREGLDGVPDTIDWPDDLDRHWRDPRLLLSQTCGHPLVTRLDGAVQVVGAMRYSAPGCDGILYRSELVVREDDPARTIDDFRGRTVAFNDAASLSGWHALRALVAPLGKAGRFFSSHVHSGSHRASLALLREGRAGIAAIDAVTLALIERHAPQELQGLRVIGSTPSLPGLPLITAAGTSASDLAALRRGLSAACADPALVGARTALCIDGFEPATLAAWQPVRALLDACVEVEREAAVVTPTLPAQN
jgi:ABC-type phosphate/phosphonate transport system substrate-binding protein